MVRQAIDAVNESKNWFDMSLTRTTAPLFLPATFVYRTRVLQKVGQGLSARHIPTAGKRIKVKSFVIFSPLLHESFPVVYDKKQFNTIVFYMVNLYFYKQKIHGDTQMKHLQRETATPE
jgi:hypothetical protein